MDYTTIISIITLVVIFVIFYKIFGNDILKIFKTIEFIFVPYGLFMWILGIFITKKVFFLHIGFIYSIFSISMLFFTWIILRIEGRFSNSANGKGLGTAYIFIFTLLLLGGILGKVFIEVYIL